MVLREGRFGKAMNEGIEAFSSSLKKDRFLAPYDIRQSIAHARALEKAGVISSGDRDRIVASLESTGRKIKQDPAYLSEGADDIHMAIEQELGDIGKKLHAGRSRNDQVACDMRMYVRDSSRRLVSEIRKLLDSIDEADRVSSAKDSLIPVYTHMQRAQSVNLSAQLGAYSSWLVRDIERLEQVQKRANLLPLGSGASAGSNIKLDIAMMADELGFEGIIRNTVDAVSGRDYVLEYASALSIFSLHLSRMAEDFIIFATKEFNFIELSDEIADTSSIMPQKKNPDCLELVRSASARIGGNCFSLFMLMKSLPLSYNRDMQDDKLIYDAAEGACELAGVMNTVMGNISFNREKMKKAACSGFTDAADFAEYLVLNKTMDFRDAHRVTGMLVREGIEKAYESISDFSLEEIKNHVPNISKDVFEFIDPGNAVQRRLSGRGE